MLTKTVTLATPTSHSPFPTTFYSVSLSPSRHRTHSPLPQCFLLPNRLLIVLLAESSAVLWDNTNHVYSPCGDTTVQRSDGFTFGISFSSRTSFFYNGNSSVHLSPCYSRISLSSSSSADRLATFWPKVDEISLLTVNTSSFSPDIVGGYMVAFAGRKYAARPLPVFIANSTFTVLEFKKGRLENVYWKRDGCVSCSGKSNFVCLNGQDCAIRTSNCKSHGGPVD